MLGLAETATSGPEKRLTVARAVSRLRPPRLNVVSAFPSRKCTRESLPYAQTHRDNSCTVRAKVEDWTTRRTLAEKLCIKMAAAGILRERQHTMRCAAAGVGRRGSNASSSRRRYALKHGSKDANTGRPRSSY